jgi:phospholipid-binding lipoprotein MlaA
MGFLRCLLATVVLVCGLAAPATAFDSDDDADALLESFEEELDSRAQGYPDPFERVNRATLRMNVALDLVIFDPVTNLYTFVVPEPMRRSLRRFFANLASPAVLVNDIIQLRFADAEVTFARLLTNTTIGVGGLLDPAAAFGLHGHETDFGHTMALAGVPSGPYLIVPIVGPTTVRDITGDFVGILFRPMTYFLLGVDSIFYSTAFGTGTGLVVREEYAPSLRRLQEGSIDYYAALRNAWYQNRKAQIDARRCVQDTPPLSPPPLQMPASPSSR